MRRPRCLSLGSLGVIALTLVLLLSGCGRTSTALAGRAAPTSTPAPLPTMAPATATTATTATTSAGAIPEEPGCPQIPAPVQPQYVAVGALSLSVPARPFGHDYPSALLPNGLPNAPYQVSLTPDEAEGIFHPNPAVNPTLTPVAGYGFQICNEASAAHTLTSLSVTIASYTPSSGPVAVWHICEHGPYDTATKQTTPGCGGALAASDFLAATLPADNSGISAPARATDMGVDLPASIGPHESITLLVAINGMTSQGTYALSFEVSVDGSAPTILTPSDGSFLIAPSAAVWTGDTCQTPAMQAQIPPSSQHTYYVCPPAS